MERKKYRPFQISCGLKEGYDLAGVEHTVEDAQRIIANWLEKRLRENRKVAVGTLLTGAFVYPWVDGSSISSRYEASFQYNGIIREDATDAEALEMLENLAKEFSDQLNQKRVHVIFCSEYFILESK